MTAVDALWLETVQAMYSRAAHELKGALNGVSVNLEVVRSRAEKPDNPATAVSRYATAASTQLEAVIAMTEAMWALGRAVREPVEIAPVLLRTVALLEPVARAEGRQLELTGDVGDLGTTRAKGNAVRLALGH